MLTLCHNGLDGSILRIHGGGHDGVTPPHRRFNIIQRKSKENEERAERKAQIQSTARQVIQARPPAEIALANDFLEDEANDSPGQVVERSSRRDGSRTTEDKRRHEILDGRLGELTGAEVEDDGNDGTDAEEPEEGGVDLPRGEDTSWADETPDHGS